MDRAEDVVKLSESHYRNSDHVRAAHVSMGRWSSTHESVIASYLKTAYVRSLCFSHVYSTDAIFDGYWDWTIKPELVYFEASYCLSSMCFTSDFFRAYANAAPKLTHICLICTKLESDDMVDRIIDSGMFASPCLEVLTLSRVTFGPGVLVRILNSVTSRVLKSVNIDQLDIDDIQLAAICGMLEKSKEKLDCVQIPVGGAVNIEPLFSMVRNASALELLYLYDIRCSLSMADIMRITCFQLTLKWMSVYCSEDSSRTDEDLMCVDTRKLWCHPSLTSFEICGLGSLIGGADERSEQLCGVYSRLPYIVNSKFVPISRCLHMALSDHSVLAGKIPIDIWKLVADSLGWNNMLYWMR